MSVKPTVAIGSAIVSVVVWGASVGARAELTTEVAPSVSVGVTTNAQGNAARARDEIGTLGVFGSLRQRGPRSNHQLGARLSYTHYFEGLGVDTLASEASGTSNFQLTAALELHMSAAATLSRTSRLDLLALAAGGPQATAAGSSLFLGTSASQGLSYQPTARWHFLEALAASRVDYLQTTNLTRRPATSLSGELRAEFIDQRNTWSLDLRATDLIRGEAAATATTPADPGGHSILAQPLLGWRRELTLDWSTQLQAGAAMLFDPNGPDVVVPAGAATVDYRRVTWFATLVVSRTPVANMFSALATINDQASLNLTLPLSRSEQVVVSGFAGLVRAQIVDGAGDLGPAYRQVTGGARVGYRFRDWPLVGAFEYSFVDQSASGAGFVDLQRHMAMVHLAGSFQWGPGTPPILGGGLYRTTEP